jgi:hypothetical protein
VDCLRHFQPEPGLEVGKKNHSAVFRLADALREEQFLQKWTQPPIHGCVSLKPPGGWGGHLSVCLGFEV